MQGSDWLDDFDATCYSHPGPFDAQSAVEVLACMELMDGVNFAFPHAVHTKLLSDPTSFNYQQLACVLRCLGPHNVPDWNEAAFLDAVGSRMAELLSEMPAEQARKAINDNLTREHTLNAMLMVGPEEFPTLWHDTSTSAAY
eukprot:358445-Chlamydomonas_euryale.AAC.24